MVGNAPVSKEPSQQSESVLSDHLIYKGLLPFDRFRHAAARRRVIVQSAIHRFRVELKDRSQTRAASSVDLVQGLTQDELAAVRGIPDVEPVRRSAPSA